MKTTFSKECGLTIIALAKHLESIPGFKLFTIAPFPDLLDGYHLHVRHTEHGVDMGPTEFEGWKIRYFKVNR